MKAIILAAGEGKRLRPLTSQLPKCMISIFGKSILNWQIETFHNSGISEIIVVTGYLGGEINFETIKIIQNKFYSTTNMVESLFCAEPELEDSVIISYGDIIFEKPVLQKLINSKDELSIIIDLEWEEFWKLRFDNPLDDAESLVFDKNNYIQNLGQKTKSLNEIMGQYIGLMKFQGNGIEIVKNYYKKFQTMSKNGNNPLNSTLPFEKSYMTDFLQGLLNNSIKIKGIPIKHGWLELDSIKDYDLYNEMYCNNKLSKFFKI